MTGIKDANGSTTTYTYDANGNLLKTSGSGVQAVYTYDLYNRLVSYSQGGVTESYTYDAEGVRRSKTTGDTTVIFISDTTGELSHTLVETDEDGTLTAAYTRGDTLISQTREDVTFTYLYDGHGDVRGLLNANGRFSDTYRYNAYGELLANKGDTENHYLYTGEYYDGTSGLYYLRARYMNPSTGTFISMDTYEGSIYDPDTLHKYLYANGNPVKYGDPSGNMFSAVAGFAAAAINTVSVLVAVTTNTVMSNFRTINAMGLISGVTNAAITSFLGGSDQAITFAFFKGYITGFALGTVMYVAAAYEILTIAEMSLLLASANTVMTMVLTIAAIWSGNVKTAIVYGTLSILSLYTACQLYNMECTVDIIGNKGSARVEFDNSDPYNPTLDGKKIRAGEPYDIGVDGENYVSNQLDMQHNNTKVTINGRDRIPDFYSDSKNIVAESKNVAKQSFTLQLRDYVTLAQERGTTLILYVRKNTVLSDPLQEAIDDGLIELRYFPW